MPLLTLTSDFGASDPLVGMVKGEILHHNEGFHLVDLTHDISPFNFMQAAYHCKSIFSGFPDQSFHLVLVNIFDMPTDHVLLVHHQGQYLGIPDNGLITMVLDEIPGKIISLHLVSGSNSLALQMAATCINAFSAITSGTNWEKLGNKPNQVEQKTRMKAFSSSQYIEGQVLMIDRFNNVVVNITIHEFEEARKGRKFKIVLLRDAFIEEISMSYSDVQEGEKLARFNQFGYLEIAVNKGFAAPLFGLGEFGLSSSQMKRQYYQTIKIFFE